MVGAVKMLQDSDKIELQEISGASSGAILAFLYIIMRADIERILEELVNVDIKEVTAVKLRSLFSNFGFICVDKFKEKLMDVSEKETGIRNPTFIELYNKYKIKLHISSFCVTDGETEYFNVDRYPNVHVIDAISASIAVPFLFASTQINDKHYVDGGLAETVPAFPFMGKHPDEVCCVKINIDNTPRTEIKDVKHFAERIISSLMKHRHTHDARTIYIELGNFDIFDFNINDKTKLELFTKGYLAH